MWLTLIRINLFATVEGLEANATSIEEMPSLVKNGMLIRNQTSALDGKVLVWYPEHEAVAFKVLWKKEPPSM